MTHKYKGLLFIGDPHVASKAPSFRKDDYRAAILNKLEFALNYSDEHELLPIILGDLFHWPRDNATSLLTQLIRLFDNRLILSITGNHDSTELTLQDDDSLSILAAAKKIHLLDKEGPWKGLINGIEVSINGTAWNERLPNVVDKIKDETTIWITHHNLALFDVDEIGIKPKEIPGIDLIVNGHMHKPAPKQVHGMTTWLNPGNIARVQRAEEVRTAVPSALKMTLGKGNENWLFESIALPHEPFENVFYPMSPMSNPLLDRTGSQFIQGLEDLESMRTPGGAGLVSFIQQNISHFDEEVATLILNLVKEVCPDEYPT